MKRRLTSACSQLAPAAAGSIRMVCSVGAAADAQGVSPLDANAVNDDMESL